MSRPATASTCFRPAEESDYPAVCRLINDEEELFLVYPRGRFPLSEAQLQELAKQRRSLTVGEQNGQVVAFANLYDFSPSGHAFIGNLIVNAEERGKGIGRALVAHMLRLARDTHGLKEACISVFADNTPALLLYGSMGFIPFAMEERPDHRARRRVLVHMKIPLTEK